MVKQSVRSRASRDMMICSELLKASQSCLAENASRSCTAAPDPAQQTKSQGYMCGAEGGLDQAKVTKGNRKKLLLKFSTHVSPAVEQRKSRSLHQ